MTRAGATEDSWESGIANESADIRLASKINFHFVRVADSRQRERQRKRENEREREREREKRREREREEAPGRKHSAIFVTYLGNSKESRST